jgi:hypothetical protein
MKLLSSSIIVLAGSVIIFGFTHTTRDETFYYVGLVGLGGFAVCLIGLGGWFVAFREK